MKRYAQSFAFGVVLLIIAVFGYVAIISIWNRTMNVADRQWYYNGKSLSSAEMRAVSLALLEENPQRPVQQICANPGPERKGFSGALVDETHGIQQVIKAPDALFDIEGQEGLAGESMFTDELACMAVFPHSLGFIDHVKFILFSTFDPSNWFQSG